MIHEQNEIEIYFYLLTISSAVQEPINSIAQEKKKKKSEREREDEQHMISNKLN